jgi:hypothetical protein
MNQNLNNDASTDAPKSSSSAIAAIRGIVGMVVGGVIGVYGFFWIIQQGFYAIMLPGTLAGVGVRVLSPHRMLWLSVVCAVFALGLGFYTEWLRAPFTRDNGLLYFITHIHQLKPIAIIMITVGAAFGFWIADRR